MVPGMTTEWLDVSDTTPRVAYTATASQAVFAVPFPFLDETHLKVYQNGVLKTLSTHYSTSGEEDEDGGAITLVTGATLNDSIVIERDVPIELSTHIPLSGELDVAAINLQFSLFVMMLQQAITDLPRTLRQPASDADDLDELPEAADRAGLYLAFDVDGQPALVASVSTAAVATAYWANILSSTNSNSTAQAALGITAQSSYFGISNWHFCR